MIFIVIKLALKLINIKQMVILRIIFLKLILRQYLIFIH